MMSERNHATVQRRQVLLPGLACSRLQKGLLTLLLVTLMTAAMPVAELLAQDDKQQAMISYSLAWEQYKQKNYVAAAPLYKQALPYYKAHYAENTKYTEGIMEQLTRCYMNMAETQEAYYDSAIVIMKEAVELTPENQKFNDMLEWLYERTGKEDETLQQLQRLFDITGDVSYIERLKDKYLAKKDYEKAIGTYDILLKNDPDNTTLQEEKLSLIRRIAGDSENQDMVKDQLMQLHLKNPENLDYVNELLLMAKKNQNEDGVLAWSDSLLKLNPKSAFAYDSQIEIFEFRGDKKKVLSLLQAKAKAITDDPSIHTRIGESYLDMQNWPAAVQAARQALKIRDGYGAAYILIGEAYDLSAENCVQKKGGAAKMNFDDKLMYKKAYDYYARAAKDPEYKTQAERKMQSVKPVIPEPGDYFMNKGKEEPTGACYQWIQ